MMKTATICGKNLAAVQGIQIDEQLAGLDDHPIPTLVPVMDHCVRIRLLLEGHHVAHKNK
jgi:hypothetical protein